MSKTQGTFVRRMNGTPPAQPRKQAELGAHYQEKRGFSPTKPGRRFDTPSPFRSSKLEKDGGRSGPSSPRRRFVFSKLLLTHGILYVGTPCSSADIL